MLSAENTEHEESDMRYSQKTKVDIPGFDTVSAVQMTAKEKEALLLRASEGDTEARRQLIDGNLRLVLSIVQRFSGRGACMDDLFQVGCIGLIKAIDRFDTGVGVQLSTYAVPMIIGEIRRYLRDDSAVRVSRSTRDLAYRACGMRDLLTKEHGREATIDEIARALGEAPEAVSAALDAIAEPVSLYEPVYADGEDSVFIMDQLKDNGSSDEQWLESIALRDAMETLGEREKKIIRLRFFANKTQMEIAEQIGISQAQVSRLEKGALQRMRKHL